MNRRAAALAAIGVFAACAAAGAQSVSVQPPAAQAEFQPPRLQTPSVTLGDAVRSTVLNNPQIRIADTSLNRMVGRAQETRGIFDSQLRVGSGLEYIEQQLVPALRKSEKDKRDIIAALADEFDLLTTALRRLVATGRVVLPRCPTDLRVFFGGFNFSNPLLQPFLQQPITVERVDPNELTLLGSNEFLAGTTLGDILGGITVANFCTNPTLPTLTPDVYFDIFRELAPRIDQSGGQGLQGILQSVSQIPLETRRLQAEIVNAVATRARLALERLGPIPDDLMKRTWTLDVGLLKPLRSGMFLQADLNVALQDQNFRGKSFDSSFGGMGQTPQFLSSISGTIGIPIARGFGRRTAAAPERAAALMVTGQRESLRHRVSEEAYRTTLAYLNLVAAQENLAVLEESVGRQSRIVQLTEQAVQTGDLAGVETDRARARAERVNSAVSDARAAIVAARVSLAEAMGLAVTDLNDTPRATEGFSAALQGGDAAAMVDELVARALANRLDVRASFANRAASEELLYGARGNARPRLDFNINGGLTNIYSSPIYKFLPDEVLPIIPSPADPGEPPIHYYSPRGMFRAIQGRYEPFVVASMTVELPFGNNTRRGRVQQAQATFTTSRIDAEDLTRRVRLNVTNVAEQLVRAARSLQQWEAAVKSNVQVLQGALQQFESRDLALIDTLLTEENITSDRLQLVRQRQIYYSTLARLRFETGELMGFAPDTTGVEGYRFDPTQFVGKPGAGIPE